MTYSFHESCQHSPPEEISAGPRIVGFPDEKREVHEILCVPADAECLQTCFPQGDTKEEAYGIHAFKFKNLGLYMLLNSQQARELAAGLMTMARDLEKHNGTSMVS